MVMFNIPGATIPTAAIKNPSINESKMVIIVCFVQKKAIDSIAFVSIIT